jgi:hypothetical protein
MKTAQTAKSVFIFNERTNSADSYQPILPGAQNPFNGKFLSKKRKTPHR